MVIAGERTVTEKKSSPDSVEKMDHEALAMSTKNLEKTSYHRTCPAVTITTRSILLKIKWERESVDYLDHITSG